MDETPDWVGEVYELACPSCKAILSVTLISKQVIDPETGQVKTKVVDEECECGLRIEVFVD